MVKMKIIEQPAVEMHTIPDDRMQLKHKDKVDPELYDKGYAAGVEAGQALEDALIDKTFPVETYSNDRVQTIGEGVFYGSAIKQVSFPNVEVIKYYAFRNCTKLVSAEFGNVTYIGQEAFFKTALPEINFPFLEYVEANAFRENTSLVRADFGAITTIGTYAFYYCSKLKTLIIRTPSVCSLPQTTTFNHTPISGGTGYIYVPDNLVESYKTAKNWSTYANQIRSIDELPAV